MRAGVWLRFEVPARVFDGLDGFRAFSSSRCLAPRRRRQLVGVTGMMLASKYEEIYPPEVRDFVYICDNAYTRDQVFPPSFTPFFLPPSFPRSNERTRSNKRLDE